MDTENNLLELKFNLNVSSTGLYYSTIISEKDCCLKFNDFLTKGYQIDTLPKSEILLFVGEKEDFKV